MNWAPGGYEAGITPRASIAAAQTSRRRLSRDFGSPSILDFFNNIGCRRQLAVRARLMLTSFKQFSLPLLVIFCF